MADLVAADATLASAVATATSTLNTALANAQKAYKPNDGGTYVKAIATARATYDAAIAAAQATHDAVCVGDMQQNKRALGLPL